MDARFELYATGGAAPEHLWAVVGDPHRLPEWTDVDAVEQVHPHPVEAGTEVVVVMGGRQLAWQVVTAESWLLEATTEQDGTRFHVGLRVVREPRGSRLVVAVALGAGGSRAWRLRLFDAPALRRRFDRWTQRALAVAAQQP